MGEGSNTSQLEYSTEGSYQGRGTKEEGRVSQITWRVDVSVQELLTNEEKEANSIMIGVPHTGTATYHHFQSIINLDTRSFTRWYDFISGYTLDLTRNIIVSHMLQQHAGWLFFLDSDIRLRPDTFTILYDSHLPIISAAYLTRSPPWKICARINSDYLSIEMFKKPHKYYQVHEVGMGACLIDRRVFTRLAAKINKWYCMADHTKDAGKFVLIYNDKEATANNWKCPKCQNTLICNFYRNTMALNEEEGLGEDFYFCKLAREYGFDIYLSNQAVVDHEPRVGDWFIDEGGAKTTVVNAGVV